MYTKMVWPRNAEDHQHWQPEHAVACWGSIDFGMEVESLRPRLGADAFALLKVDQPGHRLEVLGLKDRGVLAHAVGQTHVHVADGCARVCGGGMRATEKSV